MTTHVGALVDRFPGAKYQGTLHFVELLFRDPAPRPNTLAKLRRDAREELRIALVAPRSAVSSKDGPLRIDELAPKIAWLNDAADALAAVAIVIPTRADLATGQRDRDRLARYFDTLRKVAGRTIVWSPAGLWEADVATKVAADLGVVLAVDPLVSPLPPGPIAYARVKTLGARSRLSTGLLLEVAEAVDAAGAGTSYVAIQSPTSFRDAKNLAAIVTGDALAREREDAGELSLDEEE